MAAESLRSGQQRPELSRLELAVMDVVWRLGECSSAQVIEEFRERRDLASTTIRTVLANLRRKGYVEPVPTIGRGFRIKPTVTRSAVAKRSLSELLRNLFEGSPRLAITHLLKSERMSPEDLEEIRRLINNHQSRVRDKP